jgi:putative redox protein
MKARIKWVEDVQFIGEAGSGHSVVMDGPEAYGGHGTGIRPMEMLLLGLGGCASFDVVEISRKARQDIIDCVATIESERSEDIPMVFTKIAIHFVITGRDLKENQIQKAIQLSADRYCSASAMLAKTADITYDYEIINV